MSGGGQVTTGQPFQPVVVRVTDFSSPPNPVIGAGVTFLTTVLRPAGTSASGGRGETNPTTPDMPVILQVSQNNVTADLNGLASVVPSGSSFSAPVEVDVTASTGVSVFLDFPLEVLAAFSTGSQIKNHGGPSAPPPAGPPARIVGAVVIRECTAH